MSRFGDANEFMNDLSDMFEQRANEVGNRQLMNEISEVLNYHTEYLWKEKEE